ncbi:unnamed protein product [Arctogadus glacialis]
MFPPKEEADLTGFITVVAIVQAAGRRNTLIAKPVLHRSQSEMTTIAELNAKPSTRSGRGLELRPAALTSPADRRVERRGCERAAPALLSELEESRGERTFTEERGLQNEQRPASGQTEWSPAHDGNHHSGLSGSSRKGSRIGTGRRSGRAACLQAAMEPASFAGLARLGPLRSPPRSASEPASVPASVRLGARLGPPRSPPQSAMAPALEPASFRLGARLGPPWRPPRSPPAV